MKVAVTEIFCEVISGIALLLVVLAGLDWAGVLSLEKSLGTAAGSINLTTLTGVLIAAYLAGVVFDSVGLIFDLFCSHWICDNGPTDQETKKFWTSVDSHVLNYKDQVWAYYFCYRNIFILLVPAAVCWCGALWNRGYVMGGWLALVSFIAFGGVLFGAMRSLLNLYYRITKSF